MEDRYATPHVVKHRSVQENLSIDLMAKKHGIPIYLVEEYLDGTSQQKAEAIKKIKEFKTNHLLSLTQ